MNFKSTIISLMIIAFILGSQNSQQFTLKTTSLFSQKILIFNTIHKQTFLKVQNNARKKISLIKILMTDN